MKQETLEQQKSKSWTPVVPTKDRALSPNQLNWKFLVGDPTLRRAIKERSKVVNPDLANYQACSLSHNIHDVSGSFITNGYFCKLIRTIIPANIFF